MRLTEEELAKILARQEITIKDDNNSPPPQPEPPAIPTSGKPKRAHKYNAKKTEVDGIVFPSKKESEVYLQLKAMEEAGEISNLELQVQYVLQPEFIYRGKKIKEIKIIPDFRYRRQDGHTVVVDAKGKKATQTRSFKDKWKMLIYQHHNDLTVHFEIW